MLAAPGGTVDRCSMEGEVQSSAQQLKVLFCGEDMHYGYVFTAEALAKDEGVKVVQCERSQLALAIKTADVAVPLMSRLDEQLLRSAERLKLIIQYGVGVEGVDVAAATELGVWVTNIPSHGTGNAISCAEHAIYLMMATLRDHNSMAESIKHRRLGVPLGQTLYGKTVLVIGFGNIAKELCIRLKPFGVRVTALRRKPWHSNGQQQQPQQQQAEGQQQGEGQQQQQQEGTQEAHDAQAQGQQPQPQQQPPQHSHDPELDAAAGAVLADRGCWPQDCARLAGEADIIAVTCHQDESNRGMVGAEFLQHCKQGVRIVNVARGGLLDYDAVQEGLFTGRVAGLGLDVQGQEPVPADDWLVHHPCVYLTPHIAGVTETSYRNMAEVVAEAVRQVRQGLPPARLLNAPQRPRGAAKAAA